MKAPARTPGVPAPRPPSEPKTEPETPPARPLPRRKPSPYPPAQPAAVEPDGRVAVYGCRTIGCALLPLGVVHLWWWLVAASVLLVARYVDDVGQEVRARRELAEARAARRALVAALAALATDSPEQVNVTLR